MIAVDTSAIVTIALNEAGADAFLSRIRSVGRAYLAAPNYVEASLVLEGRDGAPGRVTLDAAIGSLRGVGLHIVVFDEQQAEFAREGFRRYGKGRHPAGLNFGDCFAYALAKALDAPLLYKGGDFDKTDVKRA